MPTPITLTIDPEEFRRRLERAAEVLLHDVRRCPSEEAGLRAGGGLDGLLRGVAALAQSAGDDGESLLEAARQTLERFRTELAAMPIEGSALS